MITRYVTFVALKIGRALLTLLVIATLTFMVLQMAGDPVTVLLGPDATDEMIRGFSERLGLDRSIAAQYGLYLANIVRGEFGMSFLHARDALDLVMGHVSATLLLSGTALLLALAIGLPLGAYAAIRHGGTGDTIAMTFAVLGYCIPNFFLAILLMLLLSIQWPLFPTAGGETLRHLVLPAITLGTSAAAIIARFTRSALLEVLGSRYMVAARSRRIAPWRLLVHHALPNAAIPVVTVVGFMVGGMISGSIIVESVFAWPGIGNLLVNSVANRDIPVVQVIVLLSGATMVVTNLVIDILYGWLDPRIGRRRHAA
ncbi:MAG: ABC transporter permease [Phyllobacteriaceae bacterium]|jgi:peptide/nickel transport system permease protein|nr:ABC transporter permease [Phyllobacteriaceae bacterium]